MLRAGSWGVVAALAVGCLEAPPTSQPTNDGNPTGIDSGSLIHFPPANADVHVVAAVAADVDGDEHKAGGAALVVGGAGGEVALVDYKPDQPYDVDLLAFAEPPTGPVTVVHRGMVTAGDPFASLVLYDGASLWRSSPIDVGGVMTLELLSTGAFLDAAFWPLRTSEEAAIFIAARSEDTIVWYDASGGTLVPFPPVVAARFGNLVSGKCGTHLALGSEPWIAQT